MSSPIEQAAAELVALQHGIPLSSALAHATELGIALEQINAVQRESRNPLMTSARDELMRARAALWRVITHWGLAHGHIDTYLLEVLGVTTTRASRAELVVVEDDAPPDRSTPPGFPDHPTGISAQKQNRHVIGTREHERRVRQEKGASAFFDRESGDSLVLEAWEKGLPVPKLRGVREHDFGRPIGVDRQHRFQTRVRAHMDSKGRLHGHPCGPALSQREATPG